MWVVLVWGLAVAGAASYRWSTRDGVYGVRWDSAVLIDWARSMAEAPRDTFLAQLLRVPATSPPKIYDVGAALALALWMAVWGAGITAAQVWANLLGLATALLLAATACPRDELRRAPRLHLVGAAVFLLMALNPPLLRQDVSPSWHGWTVFLIVLTTFLARRDWRRASWSRGRAAAIWVLLAIALHSVYLLPPILVLVWGVADLVASSPGRERRRSLAYWLPLAALPLVPGLYLLLRHSESAEEWGAAWLTPDLSRAPKVVLALWLGTALLLPALAWLRRDERRRHLPLHLFTWALLALFVLVMNRAVPERAVFVERLVVYLLPGTLLAAAALARRSRFVFGALLGAAALLLAGTFWRPEIPQRWMARAAYRVPWEIGFGKGGAAAIATADPEGKIPLLFGYSAHAAIVFIHHPGPRPIALHPAAGYLAAVAKGRERGFLERSAPPLVRPPAELLLLARPTELEPLLRAARPAFLVERLLPPPGVAPGAIAPVRLIRRAGPLGEREAA